MVRERNATGLKQHYALHPLSPGTRSPATTEEEEGGV